MTAIVNNYINQLCAANYKAYNLAVLRVCLCIWLLIRLFSGWKGFEILYGQEAFSQANLIILKSIHYQYTYFMALYVLVVLLNLFGIGKNVTAALLYLVYYFFYHLNIAAVNGGDTTVKYVLLYLAFANSYNYFTLQKTNPDTTQNKSISNGLSNLAALSIMLQFCLVYLSSAIAKLQTADWLSGQASYYAFLSERYGGGFLIKDYLKNEWLILFVTYYALALELLFPFLVWVKKWRSPLLVAALFLHAGIALFMMLYSFQLFYLLLLLFFLPAQKLQTLVAAITKKNYRLSPA